MGTIRIEMRKDKEKDGLAPIRLIYQIQGQRKYHNTGIKTYPENWDDKKQEIVYVKKGKLLDLDVKKFNNKIADIKRSIEKLEAKHEANGMAYTPETILDEIQSKPLGKRDNSSKVLFAFIDRYIDDHKATRVNGSLSVYRSLKTHLDGYEQRHKVKITFDNINYAFFQGFQNYLVSLRKKDADGKTVGMLNNITIAKILSTLKTFLNYAKEQNIDVSDKYRNFKIKRENDLEVISLTRKEFNLLYDLDLSKKPEWIHVRDVFCFSCVTSLRYSDLKQLRREHIKEDTIELKAIKTGHKTTIPLNSYSRAILKKYQSHTNPLPVISNQKSNKQLEKICDWAGINEEIEIVRKYGAERIAIKYPKHKLITMHCGRKTFASLSLEAGMSAEYVMRIGSWKDYKSFKRYMNLTDEATKGAMLAAWGSKVSKLKVV